MKNLIYLICTYFVGINLIAQNCNQAFSTANYAVANTNKAYDGNNIAHIREWTEKAMEAFSEVEEITADCGCIQVSDFAYEGYLACDKAQVEKTFEQSRFFAKRARDKAKEMMDALSKCTNIPISDIEARKFAGSTDYTSADYDTSNSANDLNVQQENLLAQQEKLLEQQQKLQEQIAEQQKQVNALKQQRANELVQQKKIKLNAEIALKEMQKSYAKLATSVGCHEAMKAANVSITKPMEALENETLTATKIYYTQKLNEIVDMFNKSFSQCSSDW